jgi:hypothetical protein
MQAETPLERGLSVSFPLQLSTMLAIDKVSDSAGEADGLV